MGLDISYYSNIKKAGEKTGDDSNYEYEIYICNPECFEYQLGSLKRDFLYESSGKSKYGSFSAGSYSSYNYWRNQLALMMGYTNADDIFKEFNERSFSRYNERLDKLKTLEGEKIEKPKPFHELICFSDCEGVIGSEIAKKLYQDFLDFDREAKTFGDGFYELYNNWKEAFKVASENGVVSFH